MLYTIENEYLIASVSDLGAELQSLRRRDTGDEYIWQGNPDIWSGHAPLLFPVVGRLKGEGYVYEGKRYELGKHGFARRSTFEAVRESENRLTMRLKSGEYKTNYPFDFVLEVTFELQKNGLKVTHRVTNKGEGDMYFSLGAHPAFYCGMGDYIEFPEDECAWAYGLRADCGLLSDEKTVQGVENHRLTITQDVFKKDALIFEGLRSDEVTLYCKGEKRITVNYGNAPCLGIWAKAGAPYVCIEPWYGVDDSAQASGVLNEKKQIVKLGRGECFRFPMCIDVY